MKHLKLIGNTMIGLEFTSKPYHQLGKTSKDADSLIMRNFIGVSSVKRKDTGNLYSFHLLFIHLSIGYMG